MASPTDQHQQQDGNGDDTITVSKSSFQRAMDVADFIRSTVSSADNLKKPENQLSFHLESTPGLLEGVAAMFFVGGLLLPVRNVVLRSLGNSLGIFPDLVLTTGQALVACNAGLLVGSLYGATVHLNELASVPISASSNTADTICNSAVVLQTENVSHVIRQDISDLSTWDPRATTLQALDEALKKCRERRSYQTLNGDSFQAGRSMQ